MYGTKFANTLKVILVEKLCYKAQFFIEIKIAKNKFI